MPFHYGSRQVERLSRLNLTTSVLGSKILYLVDRSNTYAHNMTIEIANQTASWVNVWQGNPTWDGASFTNVTFSKSDFSARAKQFILIPLKTVDFPTKMSTAA
jgi:hypothetical protein